MVKDIKNLLEEYENEKEKEEIAAVEKPKKKIHETVIKETKSFKEIRLDAHDKKILAELLTNCRESLNVIARKVKLSRENVDYRIKRMVKKGFISSFNTVFNESKLGLSRYGVFLELVNLANENEKAILAYLKESKYVSWVSTNAGKWSLVFDVIVREREEFKFWMNKFLAKFHKFIGDCMLLDVDIMEYYPEKMLGLIGKKQFDKKDITIKLDSTDVKILSMLNENAWSSFVEMASKVGLTANAVNKRVINFEKSGIIAGYSVSLDWKKLGFELYALQLKTIKFTEDTTKLVHYLENNPDVVMYYKYFGGFWDYDLGVIVRNSEELREFINDFRKRFSDSLKISDVSAILREETGYKLPKGVFG